MLQRLDLRNVTVFRKAVFKFTKHINVIHGVNGSGKSHVLKLAYVLQHALAFPPSTSPDSPPAKGALQRIFASELVEVFRPDSLGRLTTRTRGRVKATVEARFLKTSQRTSFSFHTASRSEVKITQIPRNWEARPPVFIPPREALSMYPGFVSLYDAHAIEFDRTWRDLCQLLGAPVARGPRAAGVHELLGPIEEVMGGRVDVDRAGRFYLVDDQGRIEMHLVAEGFRKLAMIARLIATGSLVGKGCLLWDEPEANLNPLLVQKVARVLFELAAQGIQVFIATHSLFLMRELHILRKSLFKDVEARYFGLHLADGEVSVQQGESLEQTGDFTALDQDLLQTDRYIDLETGAQS
ncbi:MAG: AAA family ATPase [Lentisphaeria bacterium]|nr:AAA family ATPase [Lentisphaeria bacterium]